MSGSAYVGFCERADAPETLPGLVLSLISDNVDEWCRHLESKGVELVKEPADNPPYRIDNAFVRDHNGYLIEIQ